MYCIFKHVVLMYTCYMYYNVSKNPG